MAAKTDLDDEAARVATLRIAEEHENDAAFAAALGVSTQRLNNVLNGTPLGKNFALLMCQKIPGLTLDWLYLGIPDGLPLGLRRRIEAAEASLATEVGRKGKTASPKGKEAR